MVKVLSLPETIKEKSTFRAKALRRELVVGLTPDEGPSLETSIFSFIVSGSERTFTFRVSLNTLPTLATLVRDYYSALVSLLRRTNIYEFASKTRLIECDINLRNTYTL